MEVLTLGILFFSACVLLTAVMDARRGVTMATAIFTPFYDSAAVVVAGVAATPFHIGVIALLTFPSTYNRPAVQGRILHCLLLLWMYSVIMTLLGPSLFGDVQVFVSDVSLDQQSGGRTTTLNLTSSSLAQVLYLSIHIAALRFGILDRTFAIVVLYSAGIASSLAIVVHLLGAQWPHALFDNSPTNFYAFVYEERLRGFMAEPSHLASLLVAVVAFFAAQAYADRHRLTSLTIVWIGVIGVIEGGTGTGIAGGVLCLAITGAGAIVSRLRRNLISPSFFFACLFVAISALLAASSVWHYLTSVAADKQGSVSAETRADADLNGLQALYESFGLGIGLGGTRTSSLLVLVFASVGVVGGLLFFAAAFLAIKSAIGSRDFPLGLALLGLVVSYIISNASFSSPVLWVLMGACACSVQAKQSVGRLGSGESPSRRGGQLQRWSGAEPHSTSVSAGGDATA